MSAYDETALVFACGGSELVGIVATPRAASSHPVGVVVVVGGPQYRAGSHRQFTLLCRHLARQGIASLRFDYHGLGDSEGAPALGVEGIEDDLRSAIDAFARAVPATTGVVLWGLCGAASAAALYAPTDDRVAALVMLNPWVRTEEGLAKARLRHYYLGRATDPAFWARIARGEVAVAPALRAFGASVLKAVGFGRGSAASTASKTSGDAAAASADAGSLPTRMLGSLLKRNLPTLVVLSGDADLTANEFRQVCAGSAAWRRWLGSAHVQHHDVEGSNHTFARADWRDRVAALTTQFVKAL